MDSIQIFTISALNIGTNNRSNFKIVFHAFCFINYLRKKQQQQQHSLYNFLPSCSTFTPFSLEVAWSRENVLDFPTFRLNCLPNCRSGGNRFNGQ
jgi:hypothetical protein